MNTTCDDPGCTRPLKVQIFVYDGATFNARSACERHRTLLCLDYYRPSGSASRPQAPTGEFEECKLYALQRFYDPDEFFVLLKGCVSDMLFGVETSYNGISAIMQTTGMPAWAPPSIHSMAITLLREFNARPRRITIREFKQSVNTFRCTWTIDYHSSQLSFELRVSDAVALSLLAEVPIRVDTGLLGFEHGAH